MTVRAVAQKIARLRIGESPRVLDLFAGCGGLSLGFQAAGFEIVAAVESDPYAARSHGVNFHGGAKEHCRPRDILAAPEGLTDELKLGIASKAFDVIVGGPPCQAFARVGRPKLREIEDHPKAFLHDPRARLYLEWLRYIEVCQPLAVLMENVPDVLNHGGQNIPEEICEVLASKGYLSGYTLLNSACYGVPQMRERMFLIGYRREIAGEVRFPQPTHRAELPPGYEEWRTALVRRSNPPRPTAANYIDPPQPNSELPPAVKAREAIHDLPPIDARAQLRSGRLRLGPRRFVEAVPYDHRRTIFPYGQMMRSWPGFEAPDSIRDHVIRYLPRDYDLFARMRPGDQYPEAWKLAHEMLDEKVRDLRKNGETIGPARYEQLKRETVPPYDVGKFPNKWRKLWPDRPARTLMAHLGKDSYSHIHYDSRQARTISVREAARLQSFPDGFVFCGTMNPAFRQIGNAVPPLMAKAVALEMMRVLEHGAVTREELQEWLAAE